jgi:hypothetical protein
MSAGSFSRGTAYRTPVQRTPVKHILVPGYRRDWDMWCSGSRGREDSPLGNRLCPKCRTLAREAFDMGMLHPSEVGREWFTDDQLARAAADA